MAIGLLATTVSASPLEGSVVSGGPTSVTLGPLDAPQAGAILSFDLLFSQAATSAEVDAGLLRDAVTISLVDSVGTTHLDVIVADAVAGIVAASGFGIVVSAVSGGLPAPGQPAGELLARVDLGLGGSTTATFGPGPLRLIVDLFDELDGFSSTATVSNLRLAVIPEPNTAALVLVGLTATVLGRKRVARG